jgi:xanthosine phosphorylase
MSADLLDAARRAMAQAYAPYSGFPVGAAIRAVSGAIHAGANVENAAYPQGQCAEASAIGVMVAAGDREIGEVLVIAGGADLVTPCGGCRQRLAEFARPTTPVTLAHPDGRSRRLTLGELLPYGFGAAHLGAGTAAASGDAAAVARARLGDRRPVVGIILGSGLGGLADRLADPEAIPYADLPGFPLPTVPGHAGRLVVGGLGGVTVACLQGRVHLYEGRPAAAVNVPVRTLAALGCRTLVLTNAAGSLRPELPAGALCLISDHINMLGQNPLTGANDEAIGPRFVDLSEVYDGELRAAVRRTAAHLGVSLGEGVYLATPGPSFETPAEIRAFRTLGADLVGMSTVPEAISARHAGLRVLGLSIVTNLAAGLAAAPLSHAETLREAARAGAELARLLEAAMPEIAR